MSGQPKITREQHDRLWIQYQRAINELAIANSRIAKLTEGHGVKEAVEQGSDGKPMEPMTIGIVKCPKCGQYMEVQK